MHCPRCGGSYKKIANHWYWKPEHRPKITDEQMDILTGMLMGDANLAETKNTYVVIRMTNKPFLEYLNDKLGHISYPVRLYRSAEEQFKLTKDLPGTRTLEGTSDLYGFQTAAHPDLNIFQDWRKTGEKVFPEDLKLNTTILKYWYLCDGWLKGNSMQISCSERYRNNLEKMFGELDLSPTIGEQIITFNTTESQQLLNDFGEPAPGFEEKW